MTSTEVTQINNLSESSSTIVGRLAENLGSSPKVTKAINQVIRDIVSFLAEENSSLSSLENEILGEVFLHKVDHPTAALTFLENVFNGMREMKVFDPDKAIPDELFNRIAAFELIHFNIMESMGEIEDLRNYALQLEFNKYILGRFLGIDQNARPSSELTAAINRNGIENLFVMLEKLSDKYGFGKYEGDDDPITMDLRRNLFVQVGSYFSAMCKKHARLSDIEVKPSLRFEGDSIGYHVEIFAILLFKDSGFVNSETYNRIEKAKMSLGELNVIFDDVVDVLEDNKNNDSNTMSRFVKGDLPVEATYSEIKRIIAVVDKDFDTVLRDPNINNFERALITVFRRIIPDMVVLYGMKNKLVSGNTVQREVFKKLMEDYGI